MSITLHKETKDGTTKLPLFIYVSFIENTFHLRDIEFRKVTQKIQRENMCSNKVVHFYNSKKHIATHVV